VAPFQAQVEAFASTQVIALRDAFLAAWERYRAAVHAVTAAGRPDAAADRRRQAEAHAAEVRIVYADLISQVREELKQARDPWWRRRPARRSPVGAREGHGAGAPEGQGARARPARPPATG
jgi:hypothetical protein